MSYHGNNVTVQILAMENIFLWTLKSSLEHTLKCVYWENKSKNIKPSPISVVYIFSPQVRPLYFTLFIACKERNSKLQ
jgi:hypothetical protein